MKLSLRDIEVFPAQVHLEAEPGALRIDYEGVVRLGRLAVDVEIQKSGEEFFCQAAVSVEAALECSRCLSEYETALEAQTDFIICSHDTWAEAQKEARDDEDYVFYEGGSLEADISEPVRQAIILAVPMAPLCTEDCRGLCPKCKVNRNEEDCSCTFEEIDPRWDKLSDLRG